MRCFVKNCSDDATEAWQYGAGEVDLCPAHHEYVESGESWYLDAVERVVYVGSAVPGRVVAVSAAPAEGNPGGLMLRLTLAGANRAEDVKFLVPDEEAEVLMGVLRRGRDG
ncbi:hypothetical protein [Zhihengliuella halotolerans]|uniref:hypothetical protein n=1 Tax=Zhihengliuella halotolerans TaxID=370736 RepID=UPI0011AF029F|nr:hypothetical protein [Zhihengliuella halotolerans]